MVPLTHIGKPRALLRLWVLVLLAPVAWVTALSVLFSLTNEACISGSRSHMWWVALGCIALAALPALLAWPSRRIHDSGAAESERARFMLELATGASALFALVTLLTAVPIALLDSCRT